jgi:hypothetical protein
MTIDDTCRGDNEGLESGMSFPGSAARLESRCALA